MSHHHLHFWPAAGAANMYLQLIAPGGSLLEAQERRSGSGAETYCVQEFSDRVTDSSRGAATLAAGSRPFGLGSRVSLDVSYAYPGRRMELLRQIAQRLQSQPIPGDARCN